MWRHIKGAKVDVASARDETVRKGAKNSISSVAEVLSMRQAVQLTVVVYESLAESISGTEVDECDASVATNLDKDGAVPWSGRQRWL